MEGPLGDELDQSPSIVALCLTNQVLGFASYDDVSNSIAVDKIHVSIEGADTEDIMTKLKITCNPSLFIIHPKIIANQPLLDLILSGVDGTPNFYRYVTIKSSMWNDNSAKDVICNKLMVKSATNWAHRDHNQFLYLSSVIEIDCIQVCQALGALISYMQTNMVNLDEGLITVSSVSGLSLQSYMRMDEASFQALCIFSEEMHPNVIKGGGRSKEGFSLFGLFDRTRSVLGRQRLRDWMRKPFCVKEYILERQAGVAMAIRGSNREFVNDAVKLMRKVHDIPRLLLRIKKVEATWQDWCKLFDSLSAGIPVIDSMFAFVRDRQMWLVEETNSRMRHDAANPQKQVDDDGDAEMVGVRDDVSFISTLIEQVNREESLLAFHELNNAIDFDASKQMGAVLVREGYDEALDEYRDLYMNLEAELTNAAYRVLEAVPLLRNVSVEYVPQVGYLVAVHQDEAHVITLQHSAWPRQRQNHSEASQTSQTTDASVLEQQEANRGGDGQTAWDHPPDAWPNVAENEHPAENPSVFQFVYEQDDTKYYKNSIVRALDESIGDIKNTIADRQRTLLLAVEEAVLAVEPCLQQMSYILGTLDAIISLGVLAIERKFTRPEIQDDNVVIIKNGRHPLQELTVDTFVPNDTLITEGKNVGVITGPNSSGKSVYLKQVGVLVYLAHIGSWLPCERAIIGITDRIFTRISSIETIASPHSAFSLDLNQMTKMLLAHSRRSLCLIDEFGKGTSPVDGIALLATTMKHFASPAHKGKAIFVLHFTEVLHPQVLDYKELGCIEPFCMDTLRASAELNDDVDTSAGYGHHGLSGCAAFADPVPLFKLKRGIAESSDGIACARAAGVPESVLLRAEVVKEAVSTRQVLRPAALTRRSDVLDDPNMVDLLEFFLSVDNWTGPSALSENTDDPLVTLKALLARASF